MEEFPQIDQESRNPKYVFLKEGLLNGSTSLEEVRNALLELDQSTPSRDAAEENLYFLYDPQIVEYINQHPEALSGYRIFLSFTEFHVAQRLTSRNPNDAIEHFNKALACASSDKSWAAYVEGSLLYMGGKKIPEELIVRVQQPRNVQILRNLNAGLEKRGTVFYEEDYSK